MENISGIPPPPVSPTETRVSGKTTASLGVQQAVYNLSSAVFDFTDREEALSHAIRNWQEHNVLNAGEDKVAYFEFEPRVGAAYGLLGYLRKALPRAGVSTVLASSAGAKLMEPVLREHYGDVFDNKVVLQVAASEYDPVGAQLLPDTAGALAIGVRLGFTSLSSSLALPNDGYNTAVLASVLASTGAPALHVFDGVRGSHHAFTQQQPVSAVDAHSLSRLSATVNTPLRAFKATNELLGTNMAPFEYYGPAEPQLVYVTLGDSATLAKQSETTGVINVRLYHPFLTEEFLKVLPKTATNIAVVGKQLYADVNARLRLYFGFKAGPKVELVEKVDAPSGKGTQIKVWDLDKSSTASAPARLAALAPEASAYAKFDNFIGGGVVQSDVRFSFNNEFWDIESANAAVVLDSALLKSVDPVSALVQGGKLVVAASSADALQKAIPARTKRAAVSKQLEVYALDFSKIDTKNTQGRTLSMTVQSLLWHLDGQDVDTITSRVVHANSLDTELVAATVNKIVTTLLENALSKLDLADWANAEISEKEQQLQLVENAVATSFVPVSEVICHQEASQVKEVCQLGLKKRLVFREAYGEKLELRPEVSAKTFVAKVKRNHRVTPDSYDRYIFQLELDITGTGMKYAIGEALGVHAPNNEELVSEFLNFYKVNPEEVFGVESPSGNGEVMYRTAYQLARDQLDLFGKVPKRFYSSLAAYATDEKEQQHLNKLGSSEGAAELKVRSEENFENYVDVLKEFKSARPSFAQLLELVAPLKRREYSIASSQKVHPNEVHLLVVVVDWVTKKGEKRYGQCSRYLSQLPHGAEVVVSVKPSVMKLPKDPKTPIIMAGLGTGLAPFKAFLEEKMYQRDNGMEIGPIYLFMGSRHQREEYLYGELFEAYKAANLLTHIGAAFSRDQPEKIYIQHRIQQQKEALADAFVAKKGNFYLCGPTWPVPDISAALTEIVLEGAKKDGTEVNAETLIEELKEAERYILEVY